MSRRVRAAFRSRFAVAALVVLGALGVHAASAGAPAPAAGTAVASGSDSMVWD
ncbi:hypothetical protein LZP81_32700 [Streptomyces parvulus]|uniref:Uncharacterized protein n=1 Tax=Streptomyces parvulus TaxID=146923 RepID=A0ABV5DEQ0_9ACTN|nr:MULTISPECIES: hypothetical protein [Streptomyces]MCC9158636.1 hypothetical protein [Streptomyces parvulus]MCE7691612.1 hypothetical protein [Streptomyces parvulus]MCQ4192470.1 hypothetical protein [Streptomyces parvulus]MZD55114.1 hypothetical protein [Streptomyces sp. SID5606]WHM28521.1 hypothetical protein OH540_00260 [Streptomyces sp. BPPL-273]